jgi:acyl carrier protein
MTASTFDTIQTLAADILSVPRDQITLDASPETVATWDSLQHLNLVLGLEQAFGVSFEPEEIDQMKTLRQIVALVDGKRGTST